MENSYTHTVTKEGELYVAQCLEIDVASQGKTEREAINNLGEALELFLEAPTAQACAYIGKGRSEAERRKTLLFRTVKRRLEKFHFVEIEAKGSHIKFIRRVGKSLRVAIVPNHRHVSPKTLDSILRHAGLAVIATT